MYMLNLFKIGVLISTVYSLVLLLVREKWLSLPELNSIIIIIVFCIFRMYSLYILNNKDYE